VVRVEQIPSLGDLAVLLSRASLVLSNDTGPGHLAGALSTPTITTFLPGGVYSMEVWASSLWHHGVTLEPSPFTTQQIESAVIWGDTAIINQIPPESIVAEALACLMSDAEVD
jgi:ADP-heptose:LPS heptosyltransferase